MADRMIERQLLLFGQPNASVHSGGFVAAIKVAMFRAARASSYSREQIADRMNEIAVSSGVRMTKGSARTISLDTLEKWLAAEEREHVPSLMALHVFCLALESPSPLGAWLSIYGCDVMTPADRRLRDYGRMCIEDKARAGGKRSLEKRILEDLK